ncbi:MAG: hypothetical protein EA397_04000 [Deltaproteobacteria bacterium]|nr:MAG: hypothetical protein EA397_04000 [Deltaproteobacteria bacterium]
MCHIMGQAGVRVGQILTDRGRRRQPFAEGTMSSVLPLITAARRRIRRRNILYGAVYGAWIGVGLGAATLLVSRLVWLDALPAPWLPAILLLVLSCLVGAFLGRLRPILAPRELALLLDRALGTDEVLVTLLHLEEAGKAPDSVRADLERRVADLPRVEHGLRHRAPRIALVLPLAMALAALLLLLPDRVLQPPAPAPLSAEAERLAESLSEVRDDLPQDLQHEIDEILDKLRDGEITADEAQERLRDLQEALASYEDSLSESREDLKALRDAAEALSEGGLSDDLQQPLNDMADALQDQDLDAAAQAAENLADQLEEASSADQERLAEQLERAAEALKDAHDDALQQAGESLKSAADKLAEAAEAGPGQSGQEAAQQAADELRDLKDQAGGARDLAERLRQDRDKLAKSQKANGALEASRQRLGGDPDAEAGECDGGSADGGDTEGEGQGQASGAPGTGLDAPMPGDSSGPAKAGTGHTWEDEGTFDTVGGHQDDNRLSDRTEGEIANDFESYYDPQRLEGAEGLITSVEGRVDQSGAFDAERRKLTSGREDARRARVDVPDVYVDAAERALADDRVPPSYRAAIRDYFDSME